jgi:hypothetical protein
MFKCRVEELDGQTKIEKFRFSVPVLKRNAVVDFAHDEVSGENVSSEDRRKPIWSIFCYFLLTIGTLEVASTCIISMSMAH